MPRANCFAGRTAQLLVVGITGGSHYNDVLLRSPRLERLHSGDLPVAVVRGRNGVPAHGPVVLRVEESRRAPRR